MTKTYQHPDTKEIRVADEKNDVQIAALEKLGYVAITGKDIANEETLGVVYEPVVKADAPKEPPALPKLTKPVLPGPTHDPNLPRQGGGAITREDVEGKK